ncbi:MAG: hypothetical protein WD077_09800 [Bacteroidia bacterium]
MKKSILIFLLPIFLMVGCDTQENQSSGDSGTDIFDEDTATLPAQPREETATKQNDRNAGSAITLYHNDRFNFCVSYPRETFQLDKESQNNDGKSFVNMDGFQMEAYGRNQITTDETLEEAFEFEKSENQDEQARNITYSTKGDNWFVVSGTEGGSIFYRKTYLLDDQFVTLDFSYPAEEKNKFEPVMKQILENFPGCKGQKEEGQGT